MEVNKIILSDCIAGMKALPDNCIDCCVTSPPYFALRDYGVDGQIGQESSPEVFVAKMVEVFEEVRRILKPAGTLWLNLGDSYCSTAIPGVKAKDMFGTPWMVAFALRSAGWYLRQDIIWHKPNPMPESSRDRCTKSHEYIFMLSKSSRYYYDAFAIKTPYKEKTFTTFGIPTTGKGDGSGMIASKNWAERAKVREPKQWKTPDGWDTGEGGHGSFHRNGREKGKKPDKQRGHGRRHDGFNDRWDGMSKEEQSEMGANKRSVWTVATAPFKEAHFATFPEDLIVDCIKAGSSEFGVCSACGSPFVRKTEPSERYAKVLGTGYHDHADDQAKGMKQTQGKNIQNKMRDAGIGGAEYETKGWIATCDCSAAVVPAIILDPFGGAGTTAVVARKLNRNYLLYELNPAYIAIAERRLKNELGMFL